jgi:lipoprotein-anchoring transpeptidase ErfK/SrfK
MDWNQSKSKTRLVSILIFLAALVAVRAGAEDQYGSPSPQPSDVNVPNARVRRQVLVSLRDRQLAVLENGRVLRIFQVAVGADISPSPEGTFEIVSRVTNPTYYHPGTVIPAGSTNPIGPRWIGLNQKGYGIHGTNQPRSVGSAASHGCIRLRNKDVVQLFAMVRVGDTVEIRSERDEQIAQIFGAIDAGVIDAGSPVLAQAATEPSIAVRSGQ